MGRLKSMRVTSAFRDFVLDQLSELPGLRAKSMFGGIGLYAADAFFGLIAADVLYLKVDDTNRADFEAVGAHPFKPFADRPVTMNYYDVPAAVIDDRDALVAWARKSLAVARTPKKQTSQGFRP